jgi:nicotinamidase-related amidase
MASTLPLGDPQKTAVVFIECQNGVFGAQAAIPALQAELTSLVERLVTLADAARAAGVTTVHATCVGTAGRVPNIPAPLYRLIGPASDEWHPGHPATQIIDELQDDRDIVLPRHRGLIPTYNTDLLPSLRALGAETIVFAGVSVNIAIPMSVGQAVEDGFTVVLARDAIAGTPAEYSKLVIKNTLSMLATITDVDTLAAHWKG